MPTINRYIYTEPRTVHDNRSITKYEELPVRRECGSDLASSLDCLFNNLKCGTDRNFYQPICVHPKCTCLYLHGDLGSLVEVEDSSNNFYNTPHIRFQESENIGNFLNNDFSIEVTIIPNLDYTSVENNELNQIIVNKTSDLYAYHPDSWSLGVDAQGYIFFIHTYQINNQAEALAAKTTTCRVQTGVPVNIKVQRSNNILLFYVNGNATAYELTLIANRPLTNNLFPIYNIEEGVNGGLIIGIHTLLATQTPNPFNGRLCYLKITEGNTIQLEWDVNKSYGNTFYPQIGPIGSTQNFVYFNDYYWETKDCAAEDCPDLTDCTETDLLYFQFQMPDNFNRWFKGSATHGWKERPIGNWLATLKVHSGCGNCNFSYDQYVDAAFVGINTDGKTFQQIRIDPTQLPDNFFLEFTFNLGNCQTISFFSEPYKKVYCENTVKLKSDYDLVGRGSSDCRGYFYGDFAQTFGDAPFFYSNEYRLPATIEQSGFSITRTEIKNLNFNRTIRNEIEEKYKFRTYPIPPYAAEKLKAILMGKVIYVNDNLVSFTGDILKNNDTGSMWLIDAEFIDRSGCIAADFTCE